MNNQINLGVELTDERLMEMTGGAFVDTSLGIGKPMPLYGIKPLYGIQPLYGIKPLYGIQPYYGIVPAID